MTGRPWLLGPLLIAACGDDTGPPDARQFDGAPANGTVSLTWTIADQGNPLTCSGVGATVVSLTLIPTDQPFGTTDVISCSAGMGASRPVPPDEYNVTASLGGVAAESVEFRDVVIEPGEDTPIGAAAFEVDAVGGFLFRIVAGGQGNCTPPASGGAGIDAMELELQSIGGGCVPVTFDIAAGATLPAATFTSTCPATGQAPCIAQDQDVSVAPTLQTGSYRLTIVGRIGPDPCWSRTGQFDVPAGGEIENLPQQNLLHNDGLAACNP